MRASNWLLPYRVFFLHEVFFLHDTKASKFVILLSTFSLMKLLFLHEDFPHIISKSQNLLLFYHFFFVFHEAFFLSLFHKASFSRKSQILGTSIYCDNGSAIQIVYMTSS